VKYRRNHGSVEHAASVRRHVAETHADEAEAFNSTAGRQGCVNLVETRLRQSRGDKAVAIAGEPTDNDRT
jgi:hypothetical protein